VEIVVLSVRNVFLSSLAVLFTSSLLSSQASAATYYIDYAGGLDSNNGTSMASPWRLAPGMQGFTRSYSHQNGDIFIFKGGVTWPSTVYPWIIKNGGGSGSPDIYTTNHSWFSGGSFTQPIFDDGSSHPGATGMLNVNGLGYLTFNDLTFTKCGAPQVADSDKCLVFQNTNDITLSNNTFTTYNWIAVYFVFADGANHSNFTFTGNDWSHTSGAIWFASAAANTAMHNITYTNNVFHDYSSQIGGGVHGDGAWHYFAVPANDSTQYIDGVNFSSNRFYGDFTRSYGSDGAMTGLFFVEGSMTGIIANNDMSFAPAQANMFQGLIVLFGKGNTHPMSIGIYNNSLANIGTNAMSAGVDISEGAYNVTLKNNIIYGMLYPIYVEDPAGSGTSFVSDYNLLSGGSGQLVWGSSFQSYSQWKASGRDTHGVLGVNPGWVSSPTNQHLTLGSPAIAAGTNLNLLMLTLDKDGISRPSSTAWDMGAYQFLGTVTTALPPTGLTATAQ